MYCSKCGKQIPDESVFCPECGNKCNGEGNIKANIKIPKHHKGSIIKTLCHPVNAMKCGALDLSLKVELIYIGIITLLIPLIKTLTFKLYSFNLIKSLINLAFDFSGVSKWNLNDIIEAKSQFSLVMENVFPTGKIYFLNLGSYLINYVVIIGIIFIIFKLMLKENLNKENIISIVFVISVINLFLTILCTIALMLGGTAWILMSIFSGILALILLFSGLNNIIKSNSKLIYVFSFVCMIAYVLNFYFISNNVYSIAYDIYYNVGRYII